MDGCLEAEKSLEKSVSDKSKTISSEVIRSLLKIDEAQKSKPNQSACCSYLKRNFVLIERVVLISICIAIAGGFTVPIIIYAVDTDRGDNSTISIDIDVDNCPTSISGDMQVCLLQK